jgi:hypothetical protein
MTLITRFWSRMPGKFVLSTTGAVAAFSVGGGAAPKFEGTVREWYETLVETMISAQNAAIDAGYVRRTELVNCTCGPDIATILECSVLFRPNFEIDKKIRCHDCAKVVAEEPIGTVSRRFAITLDHELPREEIRLGDWGRVIVMDMTLQ